MVENKLSAKNKDVFKILNLLGDKSRLKIICSVFVRKDICVSDLAKSLGMSMATTSHHLQVLAKGGLVSSSRNGKKICYKFSESKLADDLKKFICKYK